MSKKTCDSCQYWQYETKDVGSCHLNPPHPRDATMAWWPTTRPFSWCGCHKDKVEQQPFEELTPRDPEVPVKRGRGRPRKNPVQ